MRERWEEIPTASSSLRAELDPLPALSCLKNLSVLQGNMLTASLEALGRPGLQSCHIIIFQPRLQDLRGSVGLFHNDALRSDSKFPDHMVKLDPCMDVVCPYSMPHGPVPFHHGCWVPLVLDLLFSFYQSDSFLTSS